MPIASALIHFICTLCRLITFYVCLTCMHVVYSSDIIMFVLEFCLLKKLYMSVISNVYWNCEEGFLHFCLDKLIRFLYIYTLILQICHSLFIDPLPIFNLLNPPVRLHSINWIIIGEINGETLTFDTKTDSNLTYSYLCHWADFFTSFF